MEQLEKEQKELKRFSSPIGVTIIWTNQYPPELPGTKPPTKEYT